MKILQIFILTTTKSNHALNNAIGHMESMVEDFKKDQQLQESNDYNQQDELRESVLSVKYPHSFFNDSTVSVSS